MLSQIYISLWWGSDSVRSCLVVLDEECHSLSAVTSIVQSCSET